MNRITEIQDVNNEIIENWGLFDYLLGSGHGANFTPIMIDEIISERAAKGNIINERIHNIHIGPVMVLYRYGFLGLMLLIIFTAILLKDVLSKTNDPMYTAIRTSLMCYLFAFNMYNISTNLIFSLILASWLYLRHLKTINSY